MNDTELFWDSVSSITITKPISRGLKLDWHRESFAHIHVLYIKEGIIKTVYMEHVLRADSWNGKCVWVAIFTEWHWLMIKVPPTAIHQSIAWEQASLHAKNSSRHKTKKITLWEQNRARAYTLHSLHHQTFRLLCSRVDWTSLQFRWGNTTSH